MRNPSSYMSEKFLEKGWMPFEKNIKTQKNRENYFTNLCEISDRYQKDILQIDSFDMKDYYESCVKQVTSGKKKPSTIKAKCYQLHATYNYLIKEGLYQDCNPVQLEALPSSEFIDPKKVPTLKQIDQLLEKARPYPSLYFTIALITRCALTPGEVCSIKLSDFMCDASGITGISLRYGANIRYIPIPDDVLELLGHYMVGQPKSEYLLYNSKGKRLQLRDLEKRYKKYIYDNQDVEFTLASLRNSSIALMLASGAEEREVANFVNIQFHWIKRYEYVVKEFQSTPIDCVQIQIKPGL